MIELQSGNLAKSEGLLAASIKANPRSADCHYYLGRLYLMKNDSDRARYHFESAVALDGAHADALACLGTLLHNRNDFSAALNHFQHAIRINPKAVEALLGSGRCLMNLGRHGEALLAFDQALTINPNVTEGWLGRGNALLRLRSQDEALSAYERALAIDHRCVPAWVARGAVLTELRRYDDAFAAYNEAQALAPDFADVRIARGHAFLQLGRYQEAQNEYERALALKPASALAGAGLGNTLAALNRYDEALAAFERALASDAGCVEAWVGRGSTLCLRKDHAGALRSYEKALAIRPDLPEALFGRCEALYGLRDYDRSGEACAKALAVDLGSGQAANSGALWYDRGLILLRLDRIAEAAESFQQAIAIDPDTPLALGQLVTARLRLCDWRDLGENFERLLAGVRAGKYVSEPFTLLTTSADNADQFRCAEIHAGRHVTVAAPGHWRRNETDQKRLRIAYVSADFREHPVAYLMAGLFERHDRSRFETFAVSFYPDGSSEMQNRLRRAFDQFLDVSAISDQDVVRLLGEKEIDIAVDLMGYTEHARPNIFAFRAAPIQASYLGFPGTMGGRFMDYIIADPIVLPFDEQTCWTEKIVHLPHCYMVNDSTRTISPQARSREQEGLPENGFVFCCFNQAYKLLPATFDIWMRLLAKVQGSVLWVSRLNERAAGNLRKEADVRGIDPARLVFAPRLASQADHLARQTLADLFLDTVPYNAHSTAADALWAGLPVLTCTGKTFAGRAAASLLHAVGLPDLVTASLHEYEALALRLATDPGQLQALRSKLASNRLIQPLFDTDRFRRNIEAAYAMMWETWRRGEPSRHFSVAAS
jgi:predicted O-linked N-acetylglucosamine transferase (SPINDLY family)